MSDYPAQTALQLHWERCNQCNYDLPCLTCEIGDDFWDASDFPADVPATHACNCSKGGTGWMLRRAAADEMATLGRKP